MMQAQNPRDSGIRCAATTSLKQAPYPSLPAKAESSLTTLLLLSNHNPLRWACDWYWKRLSDLRSLKRALYERYLMGEIDLNTYKAEKAACDELLLKTKNAYAAVLAQAKKKQAEQARQDSRKEASKALFDADTLTTELAELLIDRVLVYPDKRIEIAYKIQDIFD